MNAVVKVIRENADAKVHEQIEEARRHAKSSMAKLDSELKEIDGRIETAVRTTRSVGPGGTSLKAQEYLDLKNLYFHELTNLNQTRHQALLLQHHANSTGGGGSPLDARISILTTQKKRYEQQLIKLKKISREFDDDPAAMEYSSRLQPVLDELKSLKELKKREPRVAELMIYEAEQKVNELDERCRRKLVELQDSMPQFQKYQTLVKEYDDATRRFSSFKSQNANFEMLAETQKEPISLLLAASEPSTPVRPKRALLIACVSILGCLLGLGFVVVLESLDQRVKLPEHVSVGLGLPLLGVVPRARRVAELVRGGHIWTAATPQSVEADAYRNLRASLLGYEGSHGPVVTILVTSAKAGEGKSTTALNLAATCARAGERTLLVDCDLRRPSLGEVFAEGSAQGRGLVDVVRGSLPWQRTVVRSDIPNLDFLPTGDTLDVPIEILGTLELRQLFRALASHYDRVVLDGPATLGMADCRTLGMYVDVALLVVRAGAHELGPLSRAKTILEQSRIEIAGAVFNGLSEDLGGWSSVSGSRGYSYGYGYTRPNRGRPASELPAPRRTEPASHTETADQAAAAVAV